MKKGFATIKKMLSLIMAFAMILTMMPTVVFAADAGTTLYFKPNDWTTADAWFAAYFFEGTSDPAWIKLTDSDSDGYFEGTVPTGGYKKVIFCRMDPSKTALDWGSKWNQTANITLPTGGPNCYTVNSGEWDGSGGDGNWSTYTYVEPTFTVAGVEGLCGSAWDVSNTSNDMTKNASGVYEKVYTNVAAGTYEFKVVRNHSWDKSWGSSGGNASVTVAEAGSTVTIAFNVDTETVSATVTAPEVTYNVTFNGTNVTSDGAASVKKGDDYTATLTAAEGYTLPETIAVAIGGSAVAHNYDSTTGALTISTANITGDIAITAEGVEIKTKTIYLNAGGSNLWDQANAWFAAYVWNEGGAGTWYALTDEDADGVYQFEMSGDYANVIFCRMDPAKTALSWDSKWNQTSDLTISGNYYTITGWGGTDGTWSTQTPAAPTYTVAGDSGLCGSDWDITAAANDMTKNASGVYEKVYTNVAAGSYGFKVVVNHSWDKSWGSDGNNVTVTVAETGCTVTITFEPATRKITATVTAPEVTYNVTFNGTNVTSDGAASVKKGDDYTATLTAAEGYTLPETIAVAIGDSAVAHNYDSTTGALTISAANITGDITITANGENSGKTYEVTFHFMNTLSWGAVNLYTWSADGKNTTLTGSWPGEAVSLDADGYYTKTVTYEADVNQGLNFIFNDGSAQTVDLKLEASEFVDNKAEKWVAPTTQTSGKYNCDIVDTPEAIASKSPEVDGTSVTFRYKNPDAGTVKVFGSMNDWAEGFAMAKNDYGIWSVTLKDLEPGSYEYKFVVDDSWIVDPLNPGTSNGNSTFTILNPDADDTNKVTVRIHYARADGNYDGWNLWVWSDNIASAQHDFEDVDGEKIVTIVLEDARAHQNVKFIPRYSTDSNDWAKQEAEFVVDLSDIVSGTVDYYVNNGVGTRVLGTDVVKAVKLMSADLDYDKNAIVIITGTEIQDPDTAFEIVVAEGIDDAEAIGITEVEGSGTTYNLSLDKTMELENLYKYQVEFQGYTYAIGMDAVYASDNFAKEFTYNGEDLGAAYSSGSTTFKVWAPTAEEVSVKLYATGSDAEAGAADLGTHKMTEGEKGVWSVTISGDLKNVYYTYSVTRSGETVEAVDPYARTTGVNGNRGMVIDLNSTDPSGWAGDTNPNKIASYTDAVIYELHVRDFSIDASSGVSAANRGKYLAFTEEGTTTANGATTGIDYLEDLGITHVHLLPVYDYGSVDETTSNTFNWGYDPVNYNVPEGSYSTNPYNGNVRVNEFKQMVQALHNNGISVVMDVVYNHVYDASEFCFNKIVPGYFSRVNSNASGCGNDTASEREMVRKYIVESVLYWAEEYHIDGFRFDLVGLLDVETINEIVTEVHKVRPDIIFYGEGWDMDGTNKEPGTVMAKQANASKTAGFAYFSDSMRDLLAGRNGGTTGFVSGSTGREGEIVSNFLANPWWTSNPQQVVQYVSCHDNHTLVDKLIKSTGASGVTSDIIKMNNLAAAIYMTSQGIPFIHAGEEFLREKVDENGSRVENSYNSSDYVNHIAWDNLEKEAYAANAAYYKGLIAFRKAHPALSLSSSTEVKNCVYNQLASDNVVSFWIDSGKAGESVDSIYVIFNANASAKTITLPAGDWDIYINGEKAGTEVLDTVSGSVSVAGISAMVLVQEESTEEPTPKSEVALPGSFNGWNTSSYMDFAEGSTTVVTSTLSLPAGEYEFKIKNGDDWLGNSGTIEDTTTTTSSIGWEMSKDVSANCKLKASGGAYTFTFNTSTNMLVIEHDPDGGELGNPEEYYLYGYINGVDYATGFETGDYKFDENGKLTTTFTSDSYVAVKNGDSSETYWTDGYQGKVTSVTLYDTKKCTLTQDKWDKLLVPGGVEVTFTLTVNDDDTATLSYETASTGGVQDTSGVQDGLTLHCWNWSFDEIRENMAAIAEQGYTAIQTSPVQALKEATNLSTNSVGTHWWVYYQPVDFVITNDSGNALGTKSDLERMIETAHSYGIQVIVDVVANHLGNQTANNLSSEIPDYLLEDDYWHDITVNIQDWSDREDMTQHCMSGLPDLNTANKDVQGYVLGFLKACVDIGVDGFRFDAAKSIETPDDDSSFASDFWPTVIGGAEEYAQTSFGKDLYIYGEVLDNPAINVSAYTKYMAITDNSWGNNLRGYIANGTASLAAGYHKAADASQLVIWAESHDTYADGSSSSVSEADINKTWALVAARADAMGLYLARPESMNQALGTASETGWANEEVKAANEFHNAFIGQSEVVSNEGNISYVERGTSGAVLVNVKGTAASVSITAKAMADGSYMDHITGNTFTVANGKITGSIGSTGIAVIYSVETHDVTVEETTGGKVEVSDETPAAGTTVTITATPNTGKVVDKVTVTDANGEAVSVTKNSDDTYSYVQPDSDVTVTVTFKDEAKAKHTVTVKETTGGKVTVSTKTPETGATVTITATPNTGKVVDKVTVTDKDGKSVTVADRGNGTYTYVQPDSDVTVSVTFKNKAAAAETKHTVTVKETTGGKVKVSTKTPETGTIVTITATPNTGKVVNKVTVTDENGKSVTVSAKGNGTYTYVQPDSDVTVKVTFKNKSGSPGTGDSSRIGLWSGIVLVSFLALAVLLMGRRKKFKKM